MPDRIWVLHHPHQLSQTLHLPGFDVGSLPADTYIVRVDCSVTRTEHHGDYGEYTITEVVPDSGGCIPSHTSWSREEKDVVVGFVDGYHITGEGHRTLLRFYRPGYKMVELKSWQSADEIQWRPANDWFSQDRAIDGLLNGPPATYDGERSLWNQHTKSFHHFPKLTNNSEQATRPLVFAAAEYERVATLALTAEDASHVLNKASKLREIQFASAVEGSK